MPLGQSPKYLAWLTSSTSLCPFPPSHHLLSLTFVKALVNVWLAFCSFFKLYMFVLFFLSFLPFFTLFFLRTACLLSGFSLELFWGAIPDLKSKVPLVCLCFPELCCHLILAFWNLSISFSVSSWRHRPCLFKLMINL